MIQRLLRYLGWDHETQQLKESARANLEHADVALDQLQERFEASRRVSLISATKIDKALSDSEIPYSRQARAARG